MTATNRDVQEVLSNRSLVSLAPRQTVRDAAILLSSQEIGAAPVLSDGRLVGVFSERDVLQRVVAQGLDANAIRVSEVMTPNPRTIGTTSSLVAAMDLMIAGNLRHLPVVDAEGQVISMLSMRDVPPEYRIMHRQWCEWTKGNQGVSARV